MWSFYFPQLMDSLPFFLKGLWMTFQVSGISLVLGTLLGFCVGIARAGKIKPLRYVIHFYVDFMRGTPYLVQIFIVFFILPEWGIRLDAFSAAIASLTLYGGAYICEIVAGGIEADSSNGWPLPGLWPCGPRSCSSTSPLRPWIPR
jgi:polar amino acid transport system permease protein